MKLKIQNNYCDRHIHLDYQTNDISLNGLRDSHCHLVWLGMQELGLNLDNTKSFQELIDLSYIYSKNNTNNWIVGRGWNDENWIKPLKNTSFLEELDKVFPDNPIYLKRIDGHAAIVNSKAFKIANINSNTKDPSGGKIVRDINNNPNGLLIDNAMELINNVLPKISDDELINFILEAQNKCLDFGLIEVHDMDVYLEWLPIFEYLAKESKLTLKIKSYIRAFDGEFLIKVPKPYIINNLSVTGLKFYADGALGSRGAALIEDYEDDKGNKGIFLIEENDFYDLALKGANLGFDIGTHAIGDNANRFTLDVYGKLRQAGVKNKLRIEHCQMVHPADLIKFKDYKIDAAIQPIHCISDDKMALERIGQRVKYAYPWKSLIDLGIDVSGGSDFPIESLDPLLGIKALVEPNINWQENQKINLETAIKIYSSI